MQTAFRKGRNLIFAVLCCWVTSCSSTPDLPPETSAERIQRKSKAGLQMAQQLETQLKFKQDPEVSIYLRNLAQRLAEFVSGIGDAMGVFIIKDRAKVWENYSLPGNKIYLSLGLLKRIKFENELAALIAIELGHISKGHAFEKLKKKEEPRNDYEAIEGLLPPQPGEMPETIEFFGPGGIFSYDEESRLAALEVAVKALYNSGYDPRGLVAIWSQFLKEPQFSPISESTVNKLLENTRRLIALHAPLRNPIVRSPAFLAIQKRIERL